ncbi:hypothetical protein BaRGS_00039058 [Batillaria attramentaria]|uniref:Secreted protein n=1 Tax=Batillaria attramentaria TaxID=370345 RepID=A0ABD0J4E5_9CAEN
MLDSRVGSGMGAHSSLLMIMACLSHGPCTISQDGGMLRNSRHLLEESSHERVVSRELDITLHRHPSSD